MKHIIFWSVQFLLCFLFILNLFLHARWSRAIGGFLGLLIYGMVIAAIFILDWRYAVLSFFLVWVFTALSKPLAGKFARVILGYRTGIEPPDYEIGSADEIMQGKLSVEDWLKQLGQRSAREQSRVTSITSRPDIAYILDKHKIRQKELNKLRWLLIHSRLDDIALEIFSNPSDLEDLIEFQKQGLHPNEVQRRFRQVKK
jgi:hypothetical protein